MELKKKNQKKARLLFQLFHSFAYNSLPPISPPGARPTGRARTRLAPSRSSARASASLAASGHRCACSSRVWGTPKKRDLVGERRMEKKTPLALNQPCPSRLQLLPSTRIRHISPRTECESHRLAQRRRGVARSIESRDRGGRKEKKGAGGGRSRAPATTARRKCSGGGEAAAESECAPSFPLRSHAATRVRSVERLPAERDENLYRDRSAREGVKHS